MKFLKQKKFIKNNFFPLSKFRMIKNLSGKIKKIIQIHQINNLAI